MASLKKIKTSKNCQEDKRNRVYGKDKQKGKDIIPKKSTQKTEIRFHNDEKWKMDEMEKRSKINFQLLYKKINIVQAPNKKRT